MAAKKLRCTVVTPEKSLLDEEFDAVTVPAWDGEVGILPGHARLLAKLGLGELRMSRGDRTEVLFIEGGFVQVADDKVTVLTDGACQLQDIDVSGASAEVDSLRGQGQGEKFATAKHRHLTMKRIKDRFNRS
jgi:F-type H+-transporting ATPase subunit epsilon